jgi:hypothetical protein
MRHEESMIQKIVTTHIRNYFPTVIFTCAPATAKSARQGRENKLMGYLKGWPDLFFALPKKGYNGLFIELKTDRGSVQPEQRDLMQRLNDIGYKAIICRSAEEAISAFENYQK